MRFIKVDSTTPVAEYVCQAITRHLRAGERVLWLVSGGSVIKTAAAAARQLAGEPLERLTVSLTDERPGPVGHADSNWKQLMDAGFSLPGAKMQSVLTAADTKSDSAAFSRFLNGQLEHNQFRIGLFGIGPDGHTAGIPAQGAPTSAEAAAYYEAGSFQRISMTPQSIGRLDEAVASVMGEAKQTALERLGSDLPVTEQSAQALKGAPSVTIFNDYQGETV